MNFIRGFVRKGRGVNSAQDDPESQALQKERSLCVQHLRKLFLEFLHPPAPLSLEQQELKQYQMLPLFLKAFSGTDPMQLSERFADVLQFAGHMSKLMVTEVQRRAANKTKVQASKDILMYLCHYQDEIDNRGWNLMNVLLFLTNSEMAVIECMVAASLQSIIVKCIKLFFALPVNFSSHEKCTEIQRVLVPILIRLCNHPITARELIRTDDLASLFEALTLGHKPNHEIWRSGVSEVITAITRHCFTNDIIDYIYEKSCINLCLANIEHIYESDPLAVVEMFVTLICVLKDSADVSPILLDSFHDCQGYKFLTRILLTFSTRSDDQAHEASRNLILLIGSLVTTGYSQVLPSMAISTPFQQSDYVIPKPSHTQGVSIRNLDAFKVLMDVFLQSSNESLNLSIVNSIQSLLNYDNANYFIVEAIHPFAQFIQKMPEKSPAVRTAILKLVEFVALQLLWVPSQELVAMTILFKDPSFKSSQCSVLNFLILLINHNTKYKNVLRQAGLIDVMVLALKRYSSMLKSTFDAIEQEILSPEMIDHNDEATTDYIFLLMECLRLLIESNTKNTDLFREHGGAACSHDLILFEQSRPYALKIVEQLIIDDGHDDLGMLLGLLHSTPMTDIKLKGDVLAALIKIFAINPQIRSAFQEVGGFVYVVSVLVSLEGSLSDPPALLWAECDVEAIIELVWKTFHVLTSAMKDEPVNKVIFMDAIRFKGLIDTVKLLGCFPSSYQRLPLYEPAVLKCEKIPLKGKLSSVLEVETPRVEKNSRKYFQLVISKTILRMATGNFDSWEIDVENAQSAVPLSRRIPRIFHPTAVNGLIEIMPLLCEEKYKNQKKGYSDVLLYIVYQVQHLMGSEINQQLMCDAGLPCLILEKCEEAFVNECHPLNAPLTKLFERLASQSLHPKVLRAFLRLGSPLCSKSPYAVLRAGSDKELQKSTSSAESPVDKSQVHGKMSLTFFNGDIHFIPEHPSVENHSDKPLLQEENEFQAVVDDSEHSYIKTSPDTQSQKNLHSKTNSVEDVSIDDDPFPDIDEQSTADSDIITPLSKTEERIPSLRTRSSSVSLTDSLSSSFNAVNRIEFMLEDEFEGNILDASFHDLKEEITRVCDRFEGRPLPQNLVKSVVSLTTPRDVLSTSPLQPPAFVEFSMAEDGYACLFVPSLSPQYIPLSTSHSYRSTATAAAASLALASNASERTFPPQTGIAYSGWVYLEVLPAVPSHMCSVGLLTVEKQWEEMISKRLVNSSILHIYYDLQSKSLVVNTDDRHVNERGAMKNNTMLKVQHEDLFEMHRWNHVCVVLNKSMMRTSTAQVYVNAQLVKSSKMKYIHQGIPTGADLNTVKTVAYIGTHPKQYLVSDLVWRLGPMAVFEEPLTEDGVNLIYNLGPNYIGCFQAPSVSDLYEEDGLRPKLSALVMEDKLLLSFNPHNVTVTTLSKLSAQCAKSELVLLAAEMNISSEDKHTPIRLLPNSALHLNGASRPIGLFFVGSAGIRIFCPNPVADAFVSIGGMSILLCLVAMVGELSELYASLKALTCILQSSRIARKEMDRVAGYQILAFLLKKKKHLLNTHILHLVFSLVGTVRSDRESASIPNITAFNDLLCDLEIWHNTPSDLERSLFSHFYELITQGPDQHRNIECIRKLGGVSRLIQVVQDGDISDATLNTVASVLSVLLCKTTQNIDVVVFGQYLASTLPNGESEDRVILDQNYDQDNEVRALQTTINQRNTLLDVLIHLLLETCENGKINVQFCEQLYKTLGFDWLLLFLGGSVHKTTVIRGIRMLCRMLSDPTALIKFQSGAANGHWLVGSEALTHKKINIAAGFNVSETESESSRSEHEVNHQSYKQKGIPLLTYLLEEHTDLIEIYFLLFSLLLKTNESGIQTGLRLDMETLYLIFWPAASPGKIREHKLVQVYCLEMINILLHMVRKMMSVSVMGITSEDNPVIKTPNTIINFLDFLYQNVPEIYTYCLTAEFLSFLSATLFPIEEEEKDMMEYNVEVISQIDGGLPTDKAVLTDHPSKLQVIDFLTTITIDMMQLTTGKIATFTETVLQSFPVTASSNQCKQFQTELVSSIIKEFTKGKTWTTMNFTASGANLLKYLMNGVSFGGKVVDKLWMGCYQDSYKTILQFLIHLIGNIEGSSLNIGPFVLYHSLNRVLLYQFSKPAYRITDQSNLLELLHVLSTHSKVIFSANNEDPEFIACLTHWLLVVGLQESARKGWTSSASNFIRLESITESKDADEKDNNSDSGLFKLITAAAERVWNVFFSYKKESIEEVFCIQQSSFVSYQPVPIASSGRSVAMDLAQAKNLMGEQAAKSWIAFIGNEERKKNGVLAAPTHRPVQKKLSLRISKSLKREKVPEEVFTIQETLDWITVHLKAVKALTHMKHSKFTQEILLRNHLAEKNWSNMELELISEGGIWGPATVNPLEKWTLDDVEGPSRMRKRLTRNDQFYMHYPYIEQEKDFLLTKNRVPFSQDSKLLFQFCQKYTNPRETFSEITTSDKEKPFSWRPQLYSADGFEAEDSVEEVTTQTIIQLLETGEKIFSMYRCARVRGLDSAEGLFLFGRNHFYVIDGFTLMSAESKKGSSGNGKEIKDIGTLPDGTHEPLIPVAKGNSILKRSFFKWDFDVIKEVHKRRYLLQDVAIEVFSNDGSNHLLVFPKKSARDKVYDRVLRVSPALISSQESVAGMSSDADVELGAGILSGLVSGERSVTQKWVRGEITNFQYLMFLNTLAGRSYNDLMQYPIFPWVLRDYTSQYLDLSNESIFRDFSKPMGAQGANRLENYRKRFKEWEDPTGKTPRYYYGTHYSSAMIVASYLIRVEPFTQHFLRLQGGYFDLPDRLFHSVKDSWTSASESNMADIKELIPEFFYLPDFLLNTNKFDLGTKQNGDELGDVILPPWAKGDPIEFIRLHREALECDYVSSHLHEWIDLVFGYKQVGQAAVEADNVFHHLFYEKSVDLDEIKDPLERKATIGFINNFGQMPKQLFKKSHPSKRVMRSHETMLMQTGALPNSHYFTYNDKLFFHHLRNLVPSVQPVKELKNAVGQISTIEKTIAATEVNKAIFPGSLNRIGWGYGDFSLRYFSSDEKLLAVFEGVFTGQILCAACLDSNRFVTGGSSSAINVWKVEHTKDRSYNLSLIKVLYGHRGDVLSIAVSKAYNMIVSGSEDKSCIIWDLRKFTYTRRLCIRSGGPVTCIAINNTTGDIVTCAGTHLYVWTVNGQLLVQENTSPAISGQILCCVLSEFNEWDDNNVIITGSADGFVKMWGIKFYDADEMEPKLESISIGSSPPSGSLTKSTLDYLLVDYPKLANRVWVRKLKLQHRLTMHTAYSRPDNTEPASVTALAISKDHRKVFVGDSRGRIYSWSLSDAVGRIQDHWIKDEVADVCTSCGIKFTFSERKHHCRNCGNVFCGKCSRYESPIVNLRIFKAVRVCVACYHVLKRRPSLSVKVLSGNTS